MARRNQYEGHARRMKEITRESFWEMDPPIYTGMKKGRVSRDWIYAIDGIFEKLRIPDTHLQVELTLETFERDVKIWWKVAKGHYKTDKFDWGDFTTLFYRHHCTRMLQLELKLQDR